MRLHYLAPSATLPLAAVAGVSLAAVALALFTQHFLDMQPCPWCVLQRLVFILIALLALLGLLWRSTLGQRLAAAGVMLGSLAGAAAALWQHFVASSSSSCNLTLADRIIAATTLDARLPQVFAAYASCADAQVKLLGLPYEFWSLALFVMLGVAGAWMLLKRLR